MNDLLATSKRVLPGIHQSFENPEGFQGQFNGPGGSGVIKPRIGVIRNGPSQAFQPSEQSTSQPPSPQQVGAPNNNIAGTRIGTVVQQLPHPENSPTVNHHPMNGVGGLQGAHIGTVVNPPFLSSSTVNHAPINGNEGLPGSQIGTAQQPPPPQGMQSLQGMPEQGQGYQSQVMPTDTTNGGLSQGYGDASGAGQAYGQEYDQGYNSYPAQ